MAMERTCESPDPKSMEDLGSYHFDTEEDKSIGVGMWQVAVLGEIAEQLKILNKNIEKMNKINKL